MLDIYQTVINHVIKKTVPENQHTNIYPHPTLSYLTNDRQTPYSIPHIPYTFHPLIHLSFINHRGGFSYRSKISKDLANVVSKSCEARLNKGVAGCGSLLLLLLWLSRVPPRKCMLEGFVDAEKVDEDVFCC